jgi:hypothetical protein
MLIQDNNQFKEGLMMRQHFAKKFFKDLSTLQDFN